MRSICLAFGVVVALSQSLLPISITRAGSVTTVRVAGGLEQPVYVTAPPGDASRLFIVEANSGGSQSGPMIAHIKILNLTGPNSGTINETPFLTINGLPQSEDQGLFNLAFHPNYADNGFFYVTYAVGGNGGESRVERYQVSADPDIADASSATTILRFYKPFFNHSGNWLGFSPTDLAQGKYYLYHTTGDGGSGGDPLHLAQDLSVKNGKLLRVDVGANGLADDFPDDPNSNYAIPPDNPFVNTPAADPSIWALGFRNPWRASFDRLTGDLYIGNVGEGAAEEVEFQPFDSAGGENYGWSRWEGTVVGSNPGPLTSADIFPMYQKFHNGERLSGPDRSVTGGYVYRGSIEALQGQYIFADFLGDYDFADQTGGSQIFSLQYDGSDPSTFDGTNIVDGMVLNRTAEFAPRIGAINFISSFGEDAEGNLYIVDMGNLGTPDGLGQGEIYKIVDFLFGDLNSDQMITDADWKLFKDGQGYNFNSSTPQQSYLQGDLDGDLDHDLDDFRLFRIAYEDANSDGSFAALFGVPEPSTIVLAAVALLLAAVAGRCASSTASIDRCVIH
jgi:glucose/arabinose dehydrogenase